MFKYLRNLKFMQWYSLMMITWFTGTRTIALSHTDDTARAFLAHPLSALIATLTVFYAIIVFMKYKNIFEEHKTYKYIEDLTISLGFAHLCMLIYRAAIFFIYHIKADFGYLIVDSLIVGYFLIVCITCLHTKNNTNEECSASITYHG